MVLLLEGSPISREELYSSVSDHWFLVTSLTKALLLWLLNSARAASSRKSLGGSKCLLFKNEGGHCVSGDLQCCRHFLVPFPRSVPQHNPVSELYGQFLQPHGLVFALTCTVNCGTLYRQVCAFLNHVQSIEFNQVVETFQGWSMETWCSWAQFRVS